MEATMSKDFKIRTVKVRTGEYSYPSHQVYGYLNGQRVRKNFKSRDQALGELNRLQVQAANRDGSINSVNTRLTTAQLAEAEAAFARLGDRPLTGAIDWYLTHYKPPTEAMALEMARDCFLADRTPHVGAHTLRDYKNTLKGFLAAFPSRNVHEIETTDVQGYLERQRVGKKRFNNLRGDLNAFFVYCASPLRKWTRENPVLPIGKFKVARGVPEIITAQKAAEVMAFVETYNGGPQTDQEPGCIAPYLALCLFAGLRPSLEGGEVKRLAADPKVAERINLELGVIKITPEISKVRSVRDVTIQPNLSAWLKKFPVGQFPIIPPNVRRIVKRVRKKFGLTQDVLRHTFISMHVAKFRSLGDAALQAGNSEAMIRKHYLNMVSPADAEKFWAIVPAN
jgi:integrase